MEIEERRILAIGYYYCSMNGKTFGKQIESCRKAGYNRDYAKNQSRRILGIDRLTEADSVFWKKLEGLLPQCILMLEAWFKKHENKAQTADIRELVKIIRLIGDSVGKFVKKEEIVTHNIEEKRLTLQFISRVEEVKYWKEMEIIAKSRQKELVSAKVVKNETPMNTKENAVAPRGG